MGRPSLYSQELADAIAERLITRSLRRICREDDDVPDRTTILRWMADHEDFAAKCARAGELHAQYLLDGAEDTADGCVESTAQSSKVKISFAQWYAAKLLPKKYGDRLELAGELGLKNLTDEQLEARLAALTAAKSTKGEKDGV